MTIPPQFRDNPEGIFFEVDGKMFIQTAEGELVEPAQEELIRFSAIKHKRKS